MSAAEPTIICPKCKAEIKLTAPLAESIRPEKENRFNPDYAVHPGAILEETLEARGLTKKDMASRCGISAKHLTIDRELICAHNQEPMNESGRGY